MTKDLAISEIKNKLIGELIEQENISINVHPPMSIYHKQISQMEGSMKELKVKLDDLYSDFDKLEQDIQK